MKTDDREGEVETPLLLYEGGRGKKDFTGDTRRHQLMKMSLRTITERILEGLDVRESKIKRPAALQVYQNVLRKGTQKKGGGIPSEQLVSQYFIRKRPEKKKDKRI